MLAVRMVEVSADEVVDMISVGHHFVAAVVRMFVRGMVLAAGMVGGAPLWMVVAYADRVLFDGAVGRDVVQMTVVDVVAVPFVCDSGVAAVVTVDMGVVGVGHRGLSGSFCSIGTLRVVVQVIDVIEHGFDEFSHVVVGEGVEDVLAVATRGDDAAIAQCAKPLGDGRFVGSGRCDQLGDTDFALRDQFDEAQASRVGDGLQQVGGSADGVGVAACGSDAVVPVVVAVAVVDVVVKIGRAVCLNHDFNISSIDEVCTRATPGTSGRGRRVQLSLRTRRP